MVLRTLLLRISAHPPQTIVMAMLFRTLHRTPSQYAHKFHFLVQFRASLHIASVFENLAQSGETGGMIVGETLLK